MTEGDRLIGEFVAGRFVDAATGRAVPSPVKAVALADSLDGAEARLLRESGIAGRVAVVCDATTYDVLGRRVIRALGDVETIVLDRPHADEEDAARLAELARHADALVAVGSGTLNDLCKYVTFRDGRRCAVFATAPSMNGYVTSTASITRDGMKLSLPTHAPVGVFCDLAILAAAPKHMIRAGIGDALCRSSAQIDWLMSHVVFGTAYSDVGYALQAPDEPLLLETAHAAVAGDLAAVATLVRVLTLCGFGVCVTGTSHLGSMGEHSISHYVDMFADPHPGTLHGEQVGVATRSMTRLQEQLLALDALPPLSATTVDEPAMRARYGRAAEACIKALRAKALSAADADRVNRRIEREWPALRQRLLSLILPLARLDAVMARAGVLATGEALGLQPAFWREAVGHAHEIRDRWSFLDLAAHTGLLDAFVAGER